MTAVVPPWDPATFEPTHTYNGEPVMVLHAYDYSGIPFWQAVGQDGRGRSNRPEHFRPIVKPIVVRERWYAVTDDGNLITMISPDPLPHGDGGYVAKLRIDPDGTWQAWDRNGNDVTPPRGGAG